MDTIKQPKPYTVRMTVSLANGTGDDYSPVYAIRFEIKEKLPTNVDPQQYLRKRLAEELKRHFDALTEPIENKTEAHVAAEDPLSI